MSFDFDTKLDRYAELAVKVWLNVQPGQRLLVIAPVEAALLVRLIAKHAYQNGSPIVNVNWDDPEVARLRFQFAPRESFAEHNEGNLLNMQSALERGDALLSISAQDPDLFRGLDTDFIAKTAASAAKRTRDISDGIQRSEVNWLGLGMAVPVWARRVFPDAAPEAQVEKLWQAIFHVTRMNEPDPIAAWKMHAAGLQARCEYLTAKAYRALHYVGPGTDLQVRLLDGQIWIGAGEKSARGIYFLPNIPTEEIFTAPHRLGTQGTVTMTRPVVLRGVVIDRLTLTFEEGKVVRADAGNNQQLVDKYLASDEGATRLGEVALVPHSSPISKLGITFFNTLFDENCASHLALGKAYPTNLKGGTKMPVEELHACGVNDSLIHFDFMIGSGKLNIDGITSDGTREPVMRNGEWAFTL